MLKPLKHTCAKQNSDVCTIFTVVFLTWLVPVLSFYHTNCCIIFYFRHSPPFGHGLGSLSQFLPHDHVRLSVQILYPRIQQYGLEIAGLTRPKPNHVFLNRVQRNRVASTWSGSTLSLWTILLRTLSGPAIFLSSLCPDQIPVSHPKCNPSTTVGPEQWTCLRD